jgi:hypothetical protein
MNRVFDSSGPEGKVRGTPQQIIEKYSQLHRDAQLSNDLVAAENFQQHAEHYARMLTEAQREQEAKREIVDNSYQTSQDGIDEVHVKENSNKNEKVISENDKANKHSTFNNVGRNESQKKEQNKSDNLVNTEKNEANQSEVENKTDESQEGDVNRIIAR